jgi:cation diffusion facilitator CzcD-associated flavoprotein CzcO
MKSLNYQVDPARMPHLDELTTAADFEHAAQGLLPQSLSELELLLRRDLDLIRYPARPWVLPREAPDGAMALDVLIVGGGQAGLAAAFGLLQQRVTNILVIDENPQGREGPWGTYARMPTLRTQKDVGGVDLGLPNLSLRAWFEVQHGRRAWDALYKIPTDIWSRYLAWYRNVLGIPMRNETRLVRFRPDNGLIACELAEDGAARTLWTRTLVFATGIEGNGARHVPDFIAQNLPRQRWAHTHEPIDFTSLAGKTVAVLGGAASSFDNAIMAAEHGAQAVHVHHRSGELRAYNPMGWAEFSGYLAHFPDLPAQERWRFSRAFKRFKMGPPNNTMMRARALSNLHIHPAAHWNAVRFDGERIQIDATDGALIADFVIAGTGYVVDLTVKNELADHLAVIATWRDKFTAPPGEEDESLSAAAYLGPNFEMTEKIPGMAPWLSAVFNFSRGAQMSMGPMPIGLSGIKYGVPRLVQGITRQLFVPDAARYFDGMKAWQESDDVAER